MERILVTEEQLIAILNTELHKTEDPEYYKFTEGIIRLANTDKNGCNWSTVYVQASGVSVKSVVHIANRIIFDAKRKYNLK